MARVIEIVKAHLEANGFDGLVAVDAECGCLCDDLAPCSSRDDQVGVSVTTLIIASWSFDGLPQ